MINLILSSKLKSLLFITIISLITIINWYIDGKVLFYADAMYPLGESVDYLKQFMFGWKTSFSGGIVDATGYAITPLIIIISVIKWFGFSEVHTQAIFFFSLLLTCGFGSIYLIDFLCNRFLLKKSFGIYVIPTLFFMFNLYIALSGWRMLVFLYIFYSILPLQILLFLKYIKYEQISTIFILSIISSLLLSISFTNIAFLIVYFFILFCMGIIFLNEKGYKKIMFLYLKGFLIWLGINIWYILPQIISIGATANKATSGGDFYSSLSILDTISSHASILHTLTLTGFFSLYDTLGGQWFNWSHLYKDNGILFILSLLFPIIAIITFIKVGKHNNIKKITFFGLFFLIIGIFLSKGSHAPFGFIYKNLIINFPIPFIAFRAAYEKLGLFIVLGYYFIFIAFSFLLSKKSGKINNIFSGIVIMIILSIGFPIWSGKVFETGSTIRTSQKIQIPEDYYNVSNILKEDPKSIALTLPLTGNTWSSSLWNNGKDGYLGYNILSMLSQTPIISNDVGDKKLDIFNQSIEREFKIDGVNLETLIDRQIKYIVIQKDLNYAWGESYGKKIQDYSSFIQSIQNTKNITQIYKGKNLELYKLDTNDIKKYIYIGNQNNGNIKYNEINPSKYNVEITGTGNIQLIMNTTYNEGWILSNGKLFNTQKINVKHYRFNSKFYNAWDININTICNTALCTKNTDGTYNFNTYIEYSPQKTFYFGVLFSTVFSLSILFYCLIKNIIYVRIKKTPNGHAVL